MDPHSGRSRFLLSAAAAAAILLLTAAAACSSRRAPPRSFAAAGEEQRAEALAAWRRAGERANRIGPSRLLYAARVRQGIGSISGTLAVETSIPPHAVLTGPFGAPLATYSDGALRGEKIAPVYIDPEPLLWLLAGVWKAPSPEVRGVDGDDALLEWAPAAGESDGERVEGVLNVPRARFTRLRVERGGRAIEAIYPLPPPSPPSTGSGAAGSGEAGSGASDAGGDPWPSRIDLTDVKTGSTLRLVAEGREPIGPARDGVR